MARQFKPSQFLLALGKFYQENPTYEEWFDGIKWEVMPPEDTDDHAWIRVEIIHPQSLINHFEIHGQMAIALADFMKRNLPDFILDGEYGMQTNNGKNTISSLDFKFYADSCFRQYHNGKRSNVGSFEESLYRCYYNASGTHRPTLVAAFPQFFNPEDKQL